jgi:hypothetical protein
VITKDAVIKTLHIKMKEELNNDRYGKIKVCPKNFSGASTIVWTLLKP